MTKEITQNDINSLQALFCPFGYQDLERCL